jgi:hypothetical protein
MRIFGKEWADFCRYHSRFYARRDKVAVSRLCVAGKLAFCLTPRSLYLPMVSWTGELAEYMGSRDKYKGRAPHAARGIESSFQHAPGMARVRPELPEPLGQRASQWEARHLDASTYLRLNGTSDFHAYLNA